jgi:hypothetical protein
MRTPFEFIQTMGYRHVTFVGRDEYSVERVAEFRRLSAGSQLEIREVDGDHMGCLQPALAQFLETVMSDAATYRTGRWPVRAVPVASLEAGRAEGARSHLVRDQAVSSAKNGQESHSRAGRDVALADFNGDGVLDAFVVNATAPNGEGERVYCGDGHLALIAVSGWKSLRFFLSDGKVRFKDAGPSVVKKEKRAA